MAARDSDSDGDGDRDRDDEKNLEQMDETWLLVYTNTFKNAINEGLSKPIFKNCEFDMEALELGGPCGIALWYELCDSDFAASIVAVLKNFEADLVTLQVDSIKLVRDLSQDKYHIADCTLFVQRNFRAQETLELTDTDKRIIKSDLEKDFEKKKAPKAPVAAAVVPQARATPTLPAGPGRKAGVALPAASTVATRVAPAGPGRMAAVAVAPPARAPMQARAMPKPPLGTKGAAATGGATADATPTFAGSWSLRERKMIAEKLPVLEKATATIKQILGDEWKVWIDWGAFALYTQRSGPDRAAGDNVLVKLVAAFVKCDLEKCDSSIVAAINEKCTEKEVRFTMEESLSGDQRGSAACESFAVLIALSAESWGFAYNEDCLNQTMSN